MNFKLLALPLALMVGGNVLAADAKLNTDKKKVSYAIGLQLGNDFKRGGLDIDSSALVMAIEDMMAGKTPRMSEQELTATMEMFREQQMKKQSQVGDENRAKGEAFLAANKSKPGVKTLASGVQYKVIQSGSGASPTPDNSVVAHYRGTLIDGTEFDSSIKRGEPATFPVTKVIKGWTEILQKMKIGDKWEVYIPSDLAYGARGQGPIIGPNSALIFEIELIEIK